MCTRSCLTLWLQGVEIFAAIGDTITFACAFALLLVPTSSVQYNLIIGQLMVASQVCVSRISHAV